MNRPFKQVDVFTAVPKERAKEILDVEHMIQDDPNAQPADNPTPRPGLGGARSQRRHDVRAAQIRHRESSPPAL